METAKFVPKVYVHLIRHAQAQHNYNSIQKGQGSGSVTLEEKAASRAIVNPGLTALGEAEAVDLRHRFPYMDDLTHILTSPLCRTLQTTILALEPAIRRGIQPIAIEELRETGKGSNSSGTEIAGVLGELGELGAEVLTGALRPGWEANREQAFAATMRGRTAREMIKQLADILSGKAEEGEPGPRLWNTYPFEPMQGGRDVHIAVVSHATFLHMMTSRVLKGWFKNAEFKTFRFKGDVGRGDDGAVDPKGSSDLLEMQNSQSIAHAANAKRVLAASAKAREVGPPRDKTDVRDLKDHDLEGEVFGFESVKELVYDLEWTCQF